MSDPKIIEHNPHERRLGNGIWWALWPIIGLLWLGTWYYWGFNWHQIFLGGFTGLALATWATEITGNKTPEWMASAASAPRDRKLKRTPSRPKPPRRSA